MKTDKFAEISAAFQKLSDDIRKEMAALGGKPYTERDLAITHLQRCIVTDLATIKSAGRAGDTEAIEAAGRLLDLLTGLAWDPRVSVSDEVSRG